MRKTNVVLIHADELRYDCLGFYGNPDVKTPALDALAEESAVYQQHFCAYPVCTPSRYTLLSGQYTHQHLGWSNHSTVTLNLDTLPKELKKNGWQTAAVGKMHFTPTYLDMGFDRMMLAEQDGPGRFDDDYHRELREHGLIDDIDIIDQRYEFRLHAGEEYFDNFGVKVSDLPEEYHSTSWITRKALEEIDTWEAEKPAMLMVGYIKPHHPFDPPARYAEMYDPEKLTLLPGGTKAIPKCDSSFSRGYFDFSKMDEQKLRRMMAFYYACITQIDDGVAQILSLLKEKGLYDNTMILFTSDHGDFMGFHHLGLKGNHMYDPLMHVPLMIHYPQGENCGCKDVMNSNVDVAGEILRTCGLKIPATMSQHPLQTERPYVFGEIRLPDGVGYMVRERRYKMIVEHNMNNGMLFDLQNDPCEMNNLWNDLTLVEVKRELFMALLDATAFSGRTHVNMDEHAPVNRPENALNLDRRRNMQNYFYSTSRVGQKAEASAEELKLKI